MLLTLLTKIHDFKKKDNTPAGFRDYHTGNIYHYHTADHTLQSRIPVGGDCLVNLLNPGWTRST